jgi:hypothetical protein
MGEAGFGPATSRVSSKAPFGRSAHVRSAVATRVLGHDTPDEPTPAARLGRPEPPILPSKVPANGTLLRWAAVVSNQRPLAWRSMAFVAPLRAKTPATAVTACPLGSCDGADTAQYDGVWPNEWPNGEFRARDHEGARSARDGRDRRRPHRDGRSPNRREGTGMAAATGGALSGQLDASLPAGSQRRMIAGFSRQPTTRATSGSRSGALSPIPPPGRALALSSNRVASETSSFAPSTAPVVEGAVSTRAPARRPLARACQEPQGKPASVRKLKCSSLGHPFHSAPKRRALELFL